MSNNVHVSRECVEHYAQSVDGCINQFSEIQRKFVQLDDAIQEIQIMLDNLRDQEGKCDRAIVHMNVIIEGLESQLQQLYAQLAVTPRTIPDSYVDEDGVEHIVMVPNPAYYAILDQISFVEGRLDAAKDILSRIVNQKELITGNIQRLENAIFKLKDSKEIISQEISESEPVCQDVMEKLLKICETIDEYLSVSVGALFDTSHGYAFSTASFPTSSISSTVVAGGWDKAQFFEMLINEQGLAVPNYEGTCGPCSLAIILTIMGKSTGEKDTVQTAIDRGLCTMGCDPPDNGSMNIKDFMTLGKIYGLSSEKKRNPSMSRIMRDLEQGNQVALTISTTLLRNPNTVNNLRHQYTDHFVTVTGVNLDSEGNPVSIDVWDTGLHTGSPRAIIDIATFERMKGLKDFTMISFRKR